MDFAFTEEQTLLQETARSFVAKHCPPEQAKAWDDADEFPVQLWQR
ncbi:MAG: acyl-CoA dehydrogenase family protein, partial [Actinomycetota bacterium]|nr:acyl-CoA dehydrogenase family protein [Actinomycetota bacterium]